MNSGAPEGREVPAPHVTTWACPILVFLVCFLVVQCCKISCCDVRYEFGVKRCSVRLYYYLLYRCQTYNSPIEA
jgi:hypothetical protein